MEPLFKYEKPLPVGKATRTCDVCGRVLELTAYSTGEVDHLDYNLALLSARHDKAHAAVETGDKPDLASASWKGPKAP